MTKSFLLIALFFTSFIYSQEENPQTTDVFGVQIGAIGAWLHYEKAFGNNFTADASVGYTGGFMQGTDQKLDYVFTTSFSVEPRYYYNLAKRVEKGKRITNNSGNFVALSFSYIPDIGTSTNRAGVKVDPSFIILPKYGLRRALNNNLNFHFAVGVGYQWTDAHSDGMTIGLDLKIDYNFL